MRRYGLAMVLRAARAHGGSKVVVVPAPACVKNLAQKSAMKRSLSCLGPQPPFMLDDYCAYASRLSSPAEFHAITGASARDSGDMEQLVAPKPVCIAFMSWSSPECRKFGPVYDDATRQFPNCRFFLVDTSENESAAKLALEQDVGPDRQLPVFKMFRDGIEVRPSVEGARRDELNAALQRLAA